MKEETLDVMELRNNVHNIDIQGKDSVLLIHVRDGECSVIGGCRLKHMSLVIQGVIGYLDRYRRAYNAKRYQEKDGEDS